MLFLDGRVNDEPSKKQGKSVIAEYSPSLHVMQICSARI